MDADVPENYVTQPSGHKNLKSLDGNNTASASHQRKMSMFLSRPSMATSAVNAESGSLQKHQASIVTSQSSFLEQARCLFHQLISIWRCVFWMHDKNNWRMHIQCFPQSCDEQRSSQSFKTSHKTTCNHKWWQWMSESTELHLFFFFFCNIRVFCKKRILVFMQQLR